MLGVLERARARYPGVDIDRRCGDILDCTPQRATHLTPYCQSPRFATWMPAAGLTRFAELVRPGGMVGVIGLAANNWWDLPYAWVFHCARVAVVMTRGYRG